MSLLDDLLVPVNPDYDWDVPAEEQTEFVNPVRVNNHVMLQHNAAIRVAQRVVALNRKIATGRQALGTAKDALEDFEQELLITYPAPGSATKNLKVLNAYVRQVAFEHGQREEYLARVQAVRDAERAVASLELEAETARFVFNTIKLTGEHAQTHLSFVKNEQRNAGR
jgi:hypothetical protein